MNRLDLLDLLLPHCEPATIALMYPKANGALSPGWVYGEADVDRAIDAYRNGTLASESFDSVTKQGVPYHIHAAIRLGLVPHRDGFVGVFCIDLDDHTGDGGNVGLLDRIKRFFGANPIVFTSKSGTGLHCFFRLETAIETATFTKTIKAWGFNRTGDVECFPKTAKLSQIYLPNEPNEHGGDTYIGGDYMSCMVRALPEPPSVSLTTTTLNLLRGFVKQPGRNEALNKAAFELGQKNVNRTEAHRLCMFGARLCGLCAEEPEQTRTTFDSGYDAGLSDATSGCASNGKRYLPESAPHSTSPATFDVASAASQLTDIGNAARLVCREGRHIRFCHALNSWLVWDGTRWCPDSNGVVVTLCKQTALSIFDEARDATDERQKKLSNWAVTSQRRERLTAMAALAEPDVSIGVGELDTDPWLLNCLNGTVDLRTGELRHHAREDFITKITPYDFDAAATCPRFDRFLKEILDDDNELIEYVLRWFGYCLSADITEQILPIFHGEGNNGKNVLLETVCAIMGEYASEAPPDLLTVRKHAEHPTEIADLYGKRLVVASETEDGAQLKIQLVKRLTGNARLKARRMRMDYFEFSRTHKMVLVTNNRPEVSEDTEAVWRRLRLVPFNIVIPEKHRDPNLLQTLLDEAPGILSTLVRAGVRRRDHGLQSPSAVLVATADYRRKANSLDEFLQGHCMLGDGYSCIAGELIDAYETWCAVSDRSPLKKRAFANMLKSRNCRQARKSGQRIWTGIALGGNSTNDVMTSLTQCSGLPLREQDIDG
ncbi:MAG: hypothetical protein KC983_02580 [Phycisphaerales bacterium]|nr:hypothetical protein [Phycisphaerales bacterium]